MANTKSTIKKSTTKKVETTKKVSAKKATPTTKKVVKETPAKKVEAKETPIKKVEAKETPIKKEKVAEGKTKTIKREENNFFKENTTNILVGILCLLLIANIILVVLGHKVTLKDGKEVIASVKGQDYTAEELFDELKSKYGSNLLISMVDEFITEKELTDQEKQDAKKSAKEYIESIKKQYESAGYEWETVLANYGYETEDDLLNEYLTSVKAEKVVNKYLKKDITDEEIKKYYDEKIYGTYTIKQLLVIPETTTEMTEEEVAQAEEAAKARAQEAIDRYANGEIEWAELVSEYSQDTGSKDDEGLVENFTYGDLDEAVFNASIALKDGEYTKEPVKSQYGYHVILKVSSTKKPSLKEKKEEIISALVEEKLANDNNLYNNTLATVRKNYKLDIKDTKIKSIYEKNLNK